MHEYLDKRGWHTLFFVLTEIISTARVVNSHVYYNMFMLYTNLYPDKTFRIMCSVLGRSLILNTRVEGILSLAATDDSWGWGWG
jgi:hypothetical protein